MCTRGLAWKGCSRLRNCRFMGAHIYLSLSSAPTHSLHKYKHGFRPKIYSSAHCYTFRNCGFYGVEAIKRGRERQPENVSGQVESMAVPKKPNKKFLSHIYPDWPERPNIHETIKASWVPIRGGNRLHSQVPSECDYLHSTRIYGVYQLIIAINSSTL